MAVAFLSLRPEENRFGHAGHSGDSPRRTIPWLWSTIFKAPGVRRPERFSTVGGDEIPLTLRLDTPIEIEFARKGGIMPYVLTEIATAVPAMG